MKKMLIVLGLIVLLLFVVSCAPTGKAIEFPKKALKGKEATIYKPVCGNGVVKGKLVCDWKSPFIPTCQSLGFYKSFYNSFYYGLIKAAVVCSNDCTHWVTETCSNCGNGKLDFDGLGHLEGCDGSA